MLKIEVSSNRKSINFCMGENVGTMLAMNGWFQTLFRWILKSLDFEISILSSDSQ